MGEAWLGETWGTKKKNDTQSVILNLFQDPDSESSPEQQKTRGASYIKNNHLLSLLRRRESSKGKLKVFLSKF